MIKARTEEEIDQMLKAYSHKGQTSQGGCVMAALLWAKGHIDTDTLHAAVKFETENTPGEDDW